MREAGRIVARVLERMRQLVAPGVTTGELDAEAEALIRKAGGKPAFKGYRRPGAPPFPGTICASVNDEVVHGIPGERALEEGDIISIDVGVEHRGFFGDTAVTLPVGPVSRKAAKLLRVCSESLELALAAVRPGAMLVDVGQAVQGHVETNGFSVVRDFVGHGIGTAMHQPPEVPNFVTQAARRLRLEPGLAIAIEPMINAGRPPVQVSRDNGWTVRTADGSLSAHFEHTVAVTPEGREVLTTL
jgi:methionyl aminopeptidase